MKRAKYVIIGLLVLFIVIIGYQGLLKKEEPEPIIAEEKEETSVSWGETTLIEGQIGRVTLTKDSILLKKNEEGEYRREKSIKKGEVFRVFAIENNDGIYYRVGHDFYIEKTKHMKYETPSAKKQEQLRSKVLAEKGLTNLGPQVFNESSIAAKSGMDKQGNAYMYSVLHGNPSALTIIDLNTNQVKATYKLEESTSAWGIDIDSEGVVWVAGTTKGILYSYNPNTEVFNTHGDMLAGTKDTSVQDLVVNDEYVYGVTAYGANVFAFNKKTNKRESFQPTLQNKQYAKSITTDQAGKHVYIGVGVKNELLEWVPGQKEYHAFTAPQYKNDTYVEKMKLYDDVLVAKNYPSNIGAVYSLEHKDILKEFKVTSRGFSEKNEKRNEIYYTLDAQLYSLSLEDYKIKKLTAKLPIQTDAISLDMITLRDTPDKEFLVGLFDNNGNYFILDPDTEEIEFRKFEIEPQPVNLHLLFSDVSGENIYINGYMSGGLARYNVKTQTTEQMKEISQIESAHFINGRLLIGAYPKAKLVELHEGKQWNESYIKILEKFDEQERIPALVNNGNTLFIGTYPQYSLEGGMVISVDIDTGGKMIYRNYIPNQSIITLLPHKGYIYGGSSVHANYQKASDGAKFFRFKPDNPEEKQIIELPFKSQLIQGLIEGPDGLIWGAADGRIFNYNAETEEIRLVQMLPAISGKYGNAKFTVGKDHKIYGTLEGRFFSVDPITMTYEVIVNNNTKDIAQDMNGDIYFRSYADLWKYEVKCENVNK